MQTELMLTAMALEPGQAVKISRARIVKAAEGSLESLLYDSVRESDIKEFAEQVKQNWGVTLTEDPFGGEWTMFKPRA